MVSAQYSVLKMRLSRMEKVVLFGEIPELWLISMYSKGPVKRHVRAGKLRALNVDDGKPK